MELIKITPEWRVSIVPHNLVLERRAGKSWTAEGYYYTFEGLLNGLIDKDIKDVSTIRDIVHKINTLRASIPKLSDEFKKKINIIMEIKNG